MFLNIEEQVKEIEKLRSEIINKAARLCKKNLKHQMALGSNEGLYTIETSIGCHCFLDIRIFDINKQELIKAQTIYVFDYFNSSRCNLQRIEENACVIGKEIDEAKELCEKYMKLNLESIK